MTIWVCPLSKVELIITRHMPSRVVSLLDPGFDFPELGQAYAGKHLRLRFHDVHVPTEGQIVPAVEHVDRLLGFLGAASSGEDVLIHCRAGIGRSPAAAFIAACFLNPDVPERKIAVALRRAARLARPNETLIRLADTVMAREGRMSDAITNTGRDLPWLDVEEGEAFQMPGEYR